MFEHLLMSISRLNAEEIDGNRDGYRLPDDDVTKLVSITTVTSFKKSNCKVAKTSVNQKQTKFLVVLHNVGLICTLVEDYFKELEPIPEKQPLSEFLFKFA